MPTTMSSRPTPATATDGLPAPAARRLPAPRWLDARLVAGVLLVLAAVLVGARVVSGSQRLVPVLVAAHDLAPGESVSADDLTVAEVRLAGHTQSYVSASAHPTGYVVTRPVGAGELLPAAALAPPSAAVPHRLVTVAVSAGHLPDALARGSVVDVYVNGKTQAGVTAAPHLVVSAVSVDSRGGGSRGYLSDSSTVPVVLSVPATAVADVVAAAEQGAIDLVVIPPSQVTAAGTAP